MDVLLLLLLLVEMQAFWMVSTFRLKRTQTKNGKGKKVTAINYGTAYADLLIIVYESVKSPEFSENILVTLN